MEEQLPREEKTFERKKTIKDLLRKKKVLIPLIILTPILLYMLFSAYQFWNFYRTYGHLLSNQQDSSIAPKGDDLLNPLDFQASILFSTLYVEAEPGDKIRNDIDIMTFSDGAVSGGTIVITYDPNLIEDIEVRPIVGSTSFLPNAVFSAVKYNPDNVTFSFESPGNSAPSTGRGRIAEIEFNVKDDAFANVRISTDLNRSVLYSNKQGASSPLRTGSSDLDVKLIGLE